MKELQKMAGDGRPADKLGLMILKALEGEETSDKVEVTLEVTRL